MGGCMASPGSCSSGFRSRPSRAAGISRAKGLEVSSVNSRKPKLIRPSTPSTLAANNSGRFLLKQASLGSVRLEGEEDQAKAWTVNALSRLGYKVESQGDIQLSIKHSESGYQWIVEKDGSKTGFSSLYKMARFLIQGK